MKNDCASTKTNITNISFNMAAVLCYFLYSQPLDNMPKAADQIVAHMSNKNRWMYQYQTPWMLHESFKSLL